MSKAGFTQTILRSSLAASLLPLAAWTIPPATGLTPPRLPLADPVPIVVDHTSVELFDDIPSAYLDAAAALDMLFMDRSVGMNISEGLDCLSYSSDEAAPNSCVRYTHVVPAFSVDPSEVDWSRPGGYSRSNWDYQTWPEGDCASWNQKVGCFIDAVGPLMSGYDVVSYQFSYLEVDNGSTIDDQPGGFFWDNPLIDDVNELESFEAGHPGKVVIYWTTSLARGIGTPDSETFNEQMRQYAVAQGKPLFDVADILSHDPAGRVCVDNRDGVPYNNGNNSENYPDDGDAIPSICQHYTTETDGGHLGSVSAGKIRVAKAFWVLMARIAGWDGATSGPTPTPTRTPTSTATTLVPTPTRTSSPTASPTHTATFTSTVAVSPSATTAPTSTLATTTVAALPSGTPTPTGSPTPVETATSLPTATMIPTATPGGALPGDVSLDGSVNILDVQLCVNVILGRESDPGIVTRSDVTRDGRVNILDVQAIVNIILGG